MRIWLEKRDKLPERLRVRPGGVRLCSRLLEPLDDTGHRGGGVAAAGASTEVGAGAGAGAGDISGAISDCVGPAAQWEPLLLFQCSDEVVVSSLLRPSPQEEKDEVEGGLNVRLGPPALEV